MSPEEELAHAREGLKKLREHLHEYREFVDWLVRPLIENDMDHLTRQALSVKDRPQLDVATRYNKLPEVPE